MDMSISDGAPSEIQTCCPLIEQLENNVTVLCPGRLLRHVGPYFDEHKTIKKTLKMPALRSQKKVFSIKS